MSAMSLGLFERKFDDSFLNNYILSYLEKNDCSGEVIGDNAYLEFNELGISYTFDLENTLVSFIIYNENKKEEVSKFKGELPLMLSFDFSQKDVNKLLGNPTRAHEAIEALSILYTEIYVFDDYQAAISYSDDLNSISSLQIDCPCFL